jgi:hypothetical protein
MSITRDVVLDLLPLYLAGEASTATRSLVEEYLAGDPGLAQQIRSQRADSFAKAVPSTVLPDLELRALRRTRSLLDWQRRLFGSGIFFCSAVMSNEFSFENGHLKDFHLLLSGHPAEVGIFLMLGLASWIAYFSIRGRMRMS